MKARHLIIPFLVLTCIGLISIFFLEYINIRIQFIFLWIFVFITTSIIVFRNKKWFWTSLMIGLVFIVSFIYNTLNQPIIYRIKIGNSNYEAEISRYRYKLIDKYYLFEHIIANKPSSIFSSDKTKTGIMLIPDLSLVKEDDKTVVISINGISTDTISKRKN